MDETLPRRALGGHWDLITMCAGIMLVKVHLGLETRETAKSTIARRFLDKYYRFFKRQGPKAQSIDLSHVQRGFEHSDASQLPKQDAASISIESQWTNTNNPDVSTGLKNLDVR